MKSDNTKTVKPSNLLKKAICYMLTTVMVVSGFNMVPGAVIESEAADAWKFIELEEGRYKITPTYDSDLALTNVGGNNNGNVNVETYNGSESQSWIIRKNKYEDSYAITNAKSGGLLDVVGLASGLDDDLNIALIDPVANPSNLSDTCAFKIAQYSSAAFTNNAGYYIYCGINGGIIYVADIDTKLESGQNVKTFNVHDTKNEHWDFTPVTYTVTFDPNGGTGNPYSQTIYYDRDTELLVNEFTREGYTFAGWSTSSDGDVKYSNNQIITDNLGAIETGANANKVTLYAQWTKTQATVTFDKQRGASGDDSILVTPDKKVPSINIPQKDGYTFDGYYTTKIVNNVSTLDKMIFDQKGNIVKNNDNGYIDENGKWIGGTTDITLRADWRKARTSLKFYNSANAQNPDKTIDIDEGSNVPSVEIPVKAGSTFLGYYTQKTGGFQLFDASGYPVENSETERYIQNGKWVPGNVDVDLYAHFDTSVITFSDAVENDFFAESNTYTNIPSSIDAGAVTEITTDKLPTRIGYTFAGFADELTGGTLILGANGEIASQNINSKLYGQIVEGGKWVYQEDITLYAQWTPNTYNFKFDKNTGDGNDVTLNNVDISNGYPETVTIAKQSKPGQALLGFATTPDGTDLIYKASADDTTIFEFVKTSVTTRPTGTDDPATTDIDESKNITLYAVWGTANYQVAYYDRDWKNISDENATIDDVANSRINEGKTGVTNPQQFKYGQFMLQSLNDLGYDPKLSEAVGEEPAKKVTDYYTFLGWSTKPYAKKADYEAGKQYQGGLTTTPGEIVELYAVWVKTNGADISFNGNGSLDAPASYISADDEVIFDKEEAGKKYADYKIESRYTPVREGYKFLGWAKSATETNKDKIFTPGTTVKIYEDTVFYAQWKINPTISYDAGSGSFTTNESGSNAIPAQKYAAGTNANLIDIVNPINYADHSKDLIVRPGYTFAGWMAIRSDGQVDSVRYCVKDGENITNTNLSYEMPDCNIVFRAMWTKNTYTQSVVADKDIYTVSYTGTYNKEGAITKLEGDGENAKISVPLKAGTGDYAGKYVGSLKDIPHEANVILSVEVDGKYDAENVVVKVNGTVYKPATTTVVEDTDAEDKQGATVYTYRIEDITNDKFNVDISGAVAKEYDVQYKLLNGDASEPDSAVKKYTAGTPVNLVNAADTSKYTFAGWFTSEDAAKNPTDTAKITQIPANARGNKTYYAGWVGKNYTVTFNELYGTKKADGSAANANTQELTFGTETALKTFAVAFPGTTGPNSSTFLGWATSEEDAFAKKVTYTDGQNVKDIADADITLYAVWDIDKVTISFDTDGGKFQNGKIVDTKDTTYGGTAAEAVEAVSGLTTKPTKDGYTFVGWAATKGGKTQIATNVALYNDVTYYAIWTAEEHTFRYYKNSNGSGEYDTKTTNNGETITIGKNDAGNDVKPNIPAGQRLIGWTTTVNGTNVNYSQGEQILVTKTSGTNLYPVFGDSETHTLTYSANGGSFSPIPDAATMDRVTGENKYSINTITLEPTREGYVFGGWSEKAANPTTIIKAGEAYTYTVPTTGDTVYSHVLYAVWTPITYTVTFNANKAPAADDDLINKTAADATLPTLNATLSEKVKLVEGSTSSYMQTFTYDAENESFVEPQFTYPGYVFKGWAETADGDVVYKNLQSIKNMTSEDKKNFNVYAVWAMDTPLTVTYRANGGTLKSEATAPADQKYVRIADEINVTTAAAVYVRDGYKFIGWSIDPTTYKATDNIPETGIYEAGSEYAQKEVATKTTVTLYAVWQKLSTFKVVYNFNGGAGSVPIDLNAYHVEDSTDPVEGHNLVVIDKETVPSRTGYTFMGWAFAKDAETAATLTPENVQFVYDSTSTGKFNPAGFGISKEAIASAQQAGYIGEVGDENVVNLYAVWKANGYKINYYQVNKADATKATKIGEQEFAYDQTNGTLTAVADMSFTPEVGEGQESVTNKYTATPGYEFAGWSFKAGGTLSLEDKATIKNLLTGATEQTKEFNLYAVETEKIITVTLDDSFEVIGKEFVDDSVDNKEFFNDGWGKVSVSIKNRAADDKVYTKAEGTDGATALETTGIDNDKHKYFVKYTKALNDITIPSAPGFTFEGYYWTPEGENATPVMYYDASGNAVKNADFTDDITLTAKWTPVTFQVVFKENGEKIDEMTQTFGQKFNMPKTVKNLSYNADMEVVGWTTSVDNQNPDTAAVDGMTEYTTPDKFVLNGQYSAVVIAKLYNNYNADVTMYPVYKTTRKYKVYFSSEDQKNVTNLPETQEVAWGDTFEVGFDEVILRVPYRKGYTFLGWSKTENPTTAEYPYPVATGVEYGIKNVEDNIVLYAVWEKGEEDVPVSKEEALKRLQDSYDTLMATGNYTGAQAEALTDAYEAGKNAINSTDVKTEEQVEQALTDAKSRLAAVENDQQANSATKTLEDAKTNAKDRLEDVYDAKNQSDYRAAQQTELANAKNSGINAINAAKTTDEVANALTTAKKAINSVKTDSTLTKEEEEAAAAAKKAAEEAAAKKAAEEAAAKKAAEEAAAKKAAEEAAAKKAADQAAANAVITKINAIGSPVTADSKSAIDAARSAYDALSADQKQYISQEIVTILTTAEATYKSVTTPKPTYFGEWVDGVWYNADGSQTYGPKGGWKSNSTGWWYEDEVGWYPANCWQKIDGQWYYFDSSGYRAENEWRGGYWLGSNGAWTYQPTGSWHQDANGWWYEDTTGWYATNCWLKIDGYWYYFGGDGYMLTNQYIDGYWVGADGACW